MSIKNHDSEMERREHPENFSDIIEYGVHIKSHTEAPDYEESFTAEDLLDRKCKIKFLEDGMCGGELTELFNGDLRCKKCGNTYYEI